MESSWVLRVARWLEEELTEALGLGRYERGDARRGYRNGHQTRRITTAVGAQTLDVPRGWIVDPDGSCSGHGVSGVADYVAEGAVWCEPVSAREIPVR